MTEIITLTLTASFGAEEQRIHPVLLRNEDSLVLVDCGYVSFLPVLESAINVKGLTARQITHLVLTHHDHDHMGAAAAFKAAYPQVRILASAEEAAMISATRKPLRLTQAEHLQELLPPDQKAFGEEFLKLLRSVEPVAVDETLEGGQALDCCDDCFVVATPGHSPGHISLWLPSHGTVIAGDAIALEDGRPVIANPQFTLDMKSAEASLEKLLALDAHTIICYHGGAYNSFDSSPIGV